MQCDDARYDARFDARDGDAKLQDLGSTNIMTSYDLPNAPNFEIASRSRVCDELRSRGWSDFRALCEQVRALPYGRVSNTADPLSVLRERKGTCSSKHRLLAEVARDCGHSEIELVVGIYEMSEANTPGVGAVLRTASCASIPEAHCYLRVGAARWDFTGLSAGRESPFASLLEEHVVLPETLGKTKLELHRLALDRWAPTVGRSPATAWSLREACIAVLTSNAAPSRALP
jgi:hypothetical protein